MKYLTTFLFLTFLTIAFTFETNNKVNFDTNEVIDFLLKNPKYLETIDQKKSTEFFSKFSNLRKFLIQNEDGTKRIDWEKFLKDKMTKTLIQTISNEKNKRAINLSNLLENFANIFQPLRDMMKNLIGQILMVPSCDQVALKYSTEKSKLPDTMNWRAIGFAKELINQLDKVIIFAGGNKPIDDTTWANFKPIFPYQKNIDRNLLFQKTFFYRSPDTDVNCKNDTCIKIREYKSYTWIEIAQAVCITYIPSKTDPLMPAPGHLAVKTIKKCQALYYENSIYQLTDNKGNFYVMHAFENNQPDLSVSLPANWTLTKVNLNQPLIVSPFGSGNDCYYNIVGDSLGQGYHQYIYADKFYPSS